MSLIKQVVTVVDSFIKSVLWVVFHPLKQCRGRHLKKMLGPNITSIEDVMDLMEYFKYKAEPGPLDFIPMFYNIVFAKKFTGDCNDAAVLAKWAFKQIGMKGHIYLLKRSSRSHVVFITDDKQWMVSNNDVVKIESEDWKKFVVNWAWHKERSYSFSYVLV